MTPENPTPSTDRAVGDLCACGCGERTTRTIRLLREQDRGTAEALGWAEMSVAPMRERVAVIEGHADDGIDGYVTDEG